MRKILIQAGLGVLLFLLAGCQSGTYLDRGKRYDAPAHAYSLSTARNSLRGGLHFDERCDALGGSTTFWDDSGRQFRIDYLKNGHHPLVGEHPFMPVPRLMESVLQQYLHQVITPQPQMRLATLAHWEVLYDGPTERAFAILRLDLDDSPAPASVTPGVYYYGMLLFADADLVYVLQHRQNDLMPSRMLQILLDLADGLTLPGQDARKTPPRCMLIGRPA